MKKILKLSLMLMFAFTALVGCNETSDTTSTEVTTPNINVESENNDLITITYWDNTANTVGHDSYTELLIESALPVDIEVNQVDSNNTTQVSQLLKEGKMPDVMWYDGSANFMESLGLTRTIPLEMIEEYAPTFLEIYDQNPTLYTNIMNLDNKDELFALNGVNDGSARVAISQSADFYRYDWLLDSGIDLGVEITQISDNIYVADTGLTKAKFEEVMEYFTNGDPDGNGIDDTFGASFEKRDRFDLLYSGFDFINGVNEFNGEAEFYYSVDNYKEFIKWFSDLFDKGYIDPEFYNQTRDDRWEKVNQNQVGYFLESSIALNTWASGRPPLTLIDSNPDVKILMTPGLSNDDGMGVIQRYTMPIYSGRVCYISKDVDDEKLALILQTLEYMNFGEDNISMWFGEENVDWKYNDDGDFEIINVLEVGEKGTRLFVQNAQTGKLYDTINLQETFLAGADFWLDDGIWSQNGRERYQYKSDLLNETNYDNYRIEYAGPISIINNNFFEDCIYNGLDVEENWDNYLQELDDAGYNTMMDELDKVEPLEDLILQFTN